MVMVQFLESIRQDKQMIMERSFTPNIQQPLDLTSDPTNDQQMLPMMQQSIMITPQMNLHPLDVHYYPPMDPYFYPPTFLPDLPMNPQIPTYISPTFSPYMSQYLYPQMSSQTYPHMNLMTPQPIMQSPTSTNPPPNSHPAHGQINPSLAYLPEMETATSQYLREARAQIHTNANRDAKGRMPEVQQSAELTVKKRTIQTQFTEPNQDGIEEPDFTNGNGEQNTTLMTSEESEIQKLLMERIRLQENMDDLRSQLNSNQEMLMQKAPHLHSCLIDTAANLRNYVNQFATD